jgi:UDP-N-acetylglucosamine 4-epimerase
MLDNFATGHKHNLKDFVNNPNFRLIEGDIRSTVANAAVKMSIMSCIRQLWALFHVLLMIRLPPVNVSGF